MNSFGWLTPATMAVGIIVLAVVVVTIGVILEFRSAVALFDIRVRRGRFRYGHASMLLYRRLVRPNLIRNSNGAYLAMFEIHAPDAVQYPAADLAAADEAIARGVAQFNSNMVVHCHLRNERYSEYDMRPFGPYPHFMLDWLERRRREVFTSGTCSRTKRVVSVSWEPASARQSKVTKAAARAVAIGAADEESDIAEFEDLLGNVALFLSKHGTVRRLGVVRERDRFGVMRDRSEMLAHLKWCISGRDANVNVPMAGQDLNGLLGETFRTNFELNVGGLETRLVVVKAFPDHTYPLIFQRLSDLGIDYSLIVRWLPLSSLEAQKMIKGAHTEWQLKATESRAMVDPHAAAMLSSGEQALGYLSNGGSFGLTSIFIRVCSPDRKVVKEAAQDIVSTLNDIGFPSFVSNLTAEDDYFATLPGDGYHATRKYMLSAVNLTHIFSFHEEDMGRRRAENPNLSPDTPALTYAKAGNAATLYRVNLNDSPPDVEDFIGFGGKGSGKSTLLAHIAAANVARREYAGSTTFDRGKSLYRLCRFLDGNFYDLLGKNAAGFAMFSEIRDDQCRRELLDMLEAMVNLQENPGPGRSVIRPPHRLAMEAAMMDLLQVDPKYWDLSGFLSVLNDPDQLLRPALAQYTRKGNLGTTLDCATDSFQTSRFNVVDISNIMGMAPKWQVPIMMVALWKARRQVELLKIRENNFDISWLFQIDEAHTLLKDPLGAKFIVDELKLGRRAKRTLGLWTQSVTDVEDSPIGSHIAEECRTQYFFRSLSVRDNPKLRRAYEFMGCPERGIEWLPELAPFNVLESKPASRSLQELNLSFDPATLAIIGRSRDSDNARLDRMIAEYPLTWRRELLKFEGVAPELIDEMVRLEKAATVPFGDRVAVGAA